MKVWFINNIIQNYLVSIKNNCINVCPSVQLTRWVFDYDLCTFILNHKQSIRKFCNLDETALLMLHDVLSVLYSMKNIFDNTKTPHFKAFKLLEKAVGALEDKVLYGSH